MARCQLGRVQSPIRSFAIKQSSYQRGEFIIYRVTTAQPDAEKLAVGRVVSGSPALGFVVNDDYMAAPDSFRHPQSADVVGRVWFHFPASRLPLLCGGFAVAFVILLIAAWPVTRLLRRD